MNMLVAANPKKEYTVNFSTENVKTAIRKIPENEPGKYSLITDDIILNQIRLHQKGVMLDVGYHIDFDLTKVGDDETKVLIEVSRNIGTINTSIETQIANNSLKNISSKFSTYLSGEEPVLPDPKASSNALTYFLYAAIIITLLIFAVNFYNSRQ